MKQNKYELFPQDFIKALPAVKEVNNPLIVGLLRYNNSKAVKLRQQVEKWFKNVSPEEKVELGARLRSKDDRQHLPAFYELMLHQFFLEEGYKIIKHPLLGDKRPDYLISSEKGKPVFFLEIVTVFQDEKRTKLERALDLLYEEISKIKHYFFVSVDVDIPPPSNVSYKKLKQALISWLDSFDPNIKEQGHTFTHNLNGCDIEFELIPKKVPTKDSILGMYSCLEYHGTGDCKQIRNQIQSKIQKYKEIKNKKLPFVIAVCSGGTWMIRESNLITELFGRERFVFNLRDSKKEAKIKRDFYGLLTPKPGLKEVRNTRLSAVLYCERSFDNKDRTVYNMKVIHNPYASQPLSKLIFQKLPQLVKIKKKGNNFILKWFNNNKQVILFS